MPPRSVELEVASILAEVEAKLVNLRAVVEGRRLSSPRGLVLALATGVLRNYVLLARLLTLCGYRGPLSGFRGWLARVVAYEAVFRRSAVPPERLAKLAGSIGGWDVVECLRVVDASDAWRGLRGSQLLHVKYSVPRWVASYILKRLCNNSLNCAEEILGGFQVDQPMWMRFNRSEVSAEEAIAELRSLGVEARLDEKLDDVLEVVSTPRGESWLPRLPRRRYYVQDRSSALVAHVLGPVEGTVLDPFSAPGSKTGHILWRNPAAHVVALELSLRRLESEARLLAEQGVADRTLLVQGDARSPPLRRGAYAAAVVDPDCSSMGRMGAAPETRLFLEKTGPSIVHRAARLQWRGLREALKLLPRGARVTYSTCTISVEENEGVVRRALEEGLAELEYAEPLVGVWSDILPGTQRVYPHTSRCGGGYVALLVRQ